MTHGLLHVEDFTTQRQDGLVAAVAALLGTSTCRVTLDKVNLALAGVAVLAVGQFAGQSATTEDVAALHHLTGFAGCLTGAGGQDDFLHDGLGLVGVLL